MTSPEFPISVVIPAYNEENTIGALLESLRKQTGSEPFEVIVVNNASTDRTRAITEQYAGKLSLTVIDEPRKGRGAARAAGFARAQGEIIFSTDADTVVPPNWVSSLHAHFTDPHIVAVSGTGRMQGLGSVGSALVNAIQPLGMHIFALLYKAPWLTGFNFAIRKTAYQASGGFNPNLVAMEDAELALRVKHQGQIRIVTDTPVATSGRRFAQHGVFKGLLSYIRSFRNLRHQSPLHSATLDDPR